MVNLTETHRIQMKQKGNCRTPNRKAARNKTIWIIDLKQNDRIFHTICVQLKQ